MNHILLHPHRICGYSESGITSMPRFFLSLKTTDNPPFNKKNCFLCKKRIREIWLRNKFAPSFLFILYFYGSDTFFMEEKKNNLVHIHEALDFWAELDLNQRRHIVNEFTVRPH